MLRTRVARVPLDIALSVRDSIEMHLLAQLPEEKQRLTTLVEGAFALDASDTELRRAVRCLSEVRSARMAGVR